MENNKIYYNITTDLQVKEVLCINEYMLEFITPGTLETSMLYAEDLFDTKEEALEKIKERRSDYIVHNKVLYAESVRKMNDAKKLLEESKNTNVKISELKPFTTDDLKNYIKNKVAFNPILNYIYFENDENIDWHKPIVLFLSLKNNKIHVHLTINSNDTIVESYELSDIEILKDYANMIFNYIGLIK